MRWTTEQASEPDYDPVTLEEARNHLRLTPEGSTLAHPDDDIVELYIKAATSAAESFTQRVFAQRAFTLKADAFSTRLQLPVFPIVSVEAVKYLDAAGDEQTLESSQYLIDTSVIPAVIEIDNPPTAKHQRNAIRIEVVAGYPSNNSPADADLIPRAIKQAILMTVGHFYENRETVVVGATTSKVPMAFEALLWPHRVLGL